jgi:integrase
MDAALTGARRGEVLALRWETLDLASDVLTIRHSASELRGTTSTKGTTAIKGTKTHQSRRIWMARADRQASELLASRLPPRGHRADPVDEARRRPQRSGARRTPQMRADGHSWFQPYLRHARRSSGGVKSEAASYQ